MDGTIKIMEWNLNMRSRGGKEVPDFVLGQVEIYDVVVLVEYKHDKEFEDKLEEKDFYVFANSNPLGNEVLIAIKKELVSEKNEAYIIAETCGLQTDICPNFLRVDANILGQTVSIIGVRIRVLPEFEKRFSVYNNTEVINLLESHGYKFKTILKYQWKQLDNICRHEQLECFLKVISKINNQVIILGDLNPICSRENYNKNIKNKHIDTGVWSYWWIKEQLNNGLEIYTPKDGFSLVGSDNKEYINDHIITNRKDTITKAEYSWGFIKNDTKYDKLTAEDYKSSDEIVGYPDHAILSAEIVLADTDTEKNSIS